MNRPVALITGGAKRVGRAIALHLARRGYDLLVTYNRSEADALSLKNELEVIGSRAMMLQADLTDLPSATARISAAVEQSGSRLDALINNASIYLPDGSEEQALSMYQIHCQAPLVLSRLLAEPLKLHGGCIINMCDILGARPMPGWLNYCASKAALASITMGLARELAPEIRVCGIAPGVAEWPEGYDETDKEKYLKRVPLKRAGTPEDVARLAGFLLNEGSYITGQIVVVDGGRSIA